MFDTPCHDIRGFLDVVQGVPAAGFFAMGELGPIGRRSYLHEHTASIALFSPPTGEAT